ncbi:aspartate/glutamate racemase family protein [Vibrio gazogenes]|uniref:Aspartate racemase n=1 Tax=Vibrio gazogenes DSM 21264 = NBRC 103151 TaxID=1123492 RepID=A0A1M4YUZ4_VIBGA|nr:amino acid racemase [Vibrio gazogenes]USP15108.1 amino acid racemase [Vibrio gazogenes]SHF09583.1 aspartate racemase [Vibrio gazogenes DSM 21264] [Vibrio gazogenes DSM 21264 = NBRC 103151]SJN56402.1 Aspartate racemase [Vibrio gazogenes]
MKKIGLVGGLSWISTAEYYRLINQIVRATLGGYHSAHILTESLDESKFLEAAESDLSQQSCEKMIVDAVDILLSGGAEVIALCANGVHRFEPAIRQKCNVSLVHIAEATASAVSKANIKNVGLLGVMKTMEGDFYPQKLNEKNIEVYIPDYIDRETVHNRIIDELVLGEFTVDTQNCFIDICNRLHSNGAEGIIFGCTEIPLLMKGADQLPFPVFSTTEIHCRAIVEAAIQ